ncbi:phosphoribosylanthranilate isomerase [Novimethylophilus kurashikiensis]|uniref:N-(5'-phosphoribosyl)anthranilate isomerase n=1 Tax=Novimethylophilus kurashikiensis TaxID=1825523 RepID=A0A2R5FA92_9PROT|nr:phosphoribosylanthranilate isomerase [Novimethylophilus kurashikiensis]GBG15117.1 phosphoribosylanthranilate isomerase [Novimethylophilus kurashikiensis]
MRIRAKICGITRVEDALTAARCGADAVGFVFYEKSPRNVDVERAAQIVAALPPFVTAVGLFVNEDAATVLSIRQRVGLDLLQFHGDETPEYCQSFSAPYIKALRVRPELNLIQYAADFSSARALLLDAYQEGVAGGTGKTFDWDLIPAGLSKPVILAGGLDAENVGEAIRRVRPYAVDVSGGVEQDKGIKDVAKIAAFMRGVLDAEV